MAEFFGILASIISLVSTSTKLSTQLSKFIDGFRSAPRDSQSLARELQELCSTLDRLWRIFSSTVPRENSPLLDLRDVLASCGQRFEELEKLVGPLAVRESDGMIARKLKKWKWNFQEKEVVALRNQLEIHKATLGVTLLLSTYTETALIKETANQIEQRMQEVKDKLASDGDKANSKATKASNQALWKYLESCNPLSILSSRPFPPSPLNGGRTGSQLPRVAGHEGQHLRRNSQSVPPPDTELGEDIIRSSSAASMRPLRYRSTRTLQRRNSDITQTARPESDRTEPNPQPILRERYRRGKASGQLEIQKKAAAAKELELATGEIWGDVRSLIDQDLPYEALSQQLLQAQLRLEQAREKISRQFGQGSPQYVKRPTIPAEFGTTNRETIKQPQVEKSQLVVQETESRRKAKDGKLEIKEKVKAKEAEIKKKAKEEKAKDEKAKNEAKNEAKNDKARVEKARVEARNGKAENEKVKSERINIEKAKAEKARAEKAKAKAEKAKAEKPKTKLKARKAELSNAEVGEKAGGENVKVQAAAEGVAPEQPSPSERAKEAARHRELILPKVRAGHQERESILVRNSTIGRIVEEPDEPAPERPRLDRPWPVSCGSIPFSTRVYKTHICKEVLDEDETGYTEEDDSFIIHRNVSMLDQMSLRIRTNQFRGI